MRSFRKQSIFIAALTLAVCATIASVISYNIIEKEMREFEQRDTQISIQRINTLLNLQFSNIQKQARDYAQWNLTYDYMLSLDKSYIGDNYSLPIIKNLDMDSLALLRNDHSIFLSLSGDTAQSLFSGELDQAVDKQRITLIKLITKEIALSKKPSCGTAILFDSQIYMYGFSPILNGDGEGSSRGTLIFIRKMNQPRMQQLRDLANEEFQLWGKTVTKNLDITDEHISATLPVFDTCNQPVASIVYGQVRPLKQQISTMAQILTVNSVILILATLITMYFLFDRFVLRKIEGLVHNISSVQLDSDVQQMLPPTGVSDINRISDAVNRMLSEIHDSHKQLHYDAYHDYLTGIGNRKLLLKDLDHSCAEIAENKLQRMALLLLDLDAFKEINDTHGHLAGDFVIKTIANRMRYFSRDLDLAIRIGGDEFAMLVKNLPNNSIENYAERLLARLALPIAWEGYTLQVNVSIGICEITSQCPTIQPIELLRRADIAMFSRKNQGKNGFKLYYADMEIALSARRQLEKDIEQMIADETSTMHLQPIFFDNSNKVFAVEVLSRWTHPTLGDISPSTFIAIAEETKLIMQFDRSVIRRSCMQKTVHAHYPNLRMCVNVSALTLQEHDIVAFIAKILQECCLPENCLMLEITETALSHNEDLLIQNIEAIRLLGVQFMIDDFGTGYSSFSRLNSLPLDYIKIDRSFLSALDSGENPIVHTIIRLAHGMHMRVIAEGVESDIQHRKLFAMQCDFQQGYYLAKPMSCEQFLDALNEFKYII